jgi:hypothetical protein
MGASAMEDASAGRAVIVLIGRDRRNPATEAGKAGTACREGGPDWLATRIGWERRRFAGHLRMQCSKI